MSNREFKSQQVAFLQKHLVKYVFLFELIGQKKVVSVVKHEYASALIDSLGNQFPGCWSSSGYNVRSKTNDFLFTFTCTDKKCGKVLKIIFNKSDVLTNECDVKFSILEENKTSEHDPDTLRTRKWAGHKREELKNLMETQNNVQVIAKMTENASSQQLRAGYTTVPTIKTIKTVKKSLDDSSFIRCVKLSNPKSSVILFKDAQVDILISQMTNYKFSRVHLDATGSLVRPTQPGRKMLNHILLLPVQVHLCFPFSGT